MRNRGARARGSLVTVGDGDGEGGRWRQHGTGQMRGPRADLGLEARCGVRAGARERVGRRTGVRMTVRGSSARVPVVQRGTAWPRRRAAGPAGRSARVGRARETIARWGRIGVVQRGEGQCEMKEHSPEQSVRHMWGTTASATAKRPRGCGRRRVGEAEAEAEADRGDSCQRPRRGMARRQQAPGSR